MGFLISLLLLLQKDLRVMRRRKWSFAVELIFAILVLLFLFLVLWITGKLVQGDLKIDFDFVDVPQERLHGEYFVSYPEDLGIDMRYVLSRTCPGPNFYSNDSNVKLNIETIEVAEKKLEYTIVELSTESESMPLTELQGGIFADTKNGNTLKRYKRDINRFNLQAGDFENHFENEEIYVDKADLLLLQRCITKAFALLTNSEEYPRMIPLVMPNPPKGFVFMQIIALMISMLFLVIIAMATKEIVVEKDNGIYAYLVAVGLPRPTFYLSHFIFVSLKVTFVSLIIFAFLIVCNTKLSVRVFLVIICYAHVLAAFTMTMAAIFKRSLYVVLTLVAYVMGGAIFQNAMKIKAYDSTKALIFSLLHPQIAFGMIMDHYGIGLEYHQSLTYFTGYKYYLPIVYPFFGLLLQFVFFMALTFYIDYAVPVDDTPKLHPLFFLGFRKDVVDDDGEAENVEDDANNSRHEKYEPSGTLQLEVKNLVKKWSNGEVAVDHVSFTAHTGQVVALLGHNGAGKSTTFACLTGFLKPTSGSIRLIDNSGRVGYCPQWDPLFPKLTVSEHLSFYAKLFTGDWPEDNVIEATLERIELDHAGSTLAANLSGGMKRKLSLGIALVGGHSVVLLDEPTAGIDTLSRRNMAQIIEKIKDDHAVVVTTHYMDEADAISDHINIMAHGKIICSGSSQFLKTKYATGIILVVDLEVSHRENMETVEKCANAVLAAVKQHVPDAEFYGPISYQFNIVLQAKHRPLFPVLFEDLEKKQAELKIESFDVTMNTLDQVFVNVTKQNTEDIKPDEEIKQFIENRKDISTGVCLVFKQFIALLLRRFHTFRRDILQILLIILCIGLIGCAIPLKLKRQKDLSEMEYVETDVVAKSVNLDYGAHFKNMPVAIFDYGGFADVKAKLEAKLKSMGVEVRHYEAKDNDKDRATQYNKARYMLPVPAIIFFLGEINLISLYNPGLENADFFAQQLYYDAMLPDATIKATIAFEPIKTKHESFSQPKIVDPDFSTFILILVYPIIFALPVFIYTGERVSGAVHLYARTSMKRITYWATALISDITIVIILNIIIGTILFAAKFYHVSCMGPYYLSMIAMSFGFLMQTYVASHLFSSANVNFTLLIVYNLIFTFMFFIAMMLIFLDFKQIVYVRAVLPSLAMIDMLERMDRMCNEAVSFTKLFECQEGQCDVHPMITMLGSTVVFGVILALVLGIPRLFGLCTSRNTSRTDNNESPDVTKERERVNEGGIEAHAVVAMGLKKVFNRFVWSERKTVVTDVTFGVGKNECFGLLGPNGAGKSTTFNMMTAMLRPTAGKAYVGGVSVNNSPEFGFCPQKESILQDLTVYETFLLFARLNGISQTYDIARSVMNCLQLTTRKNILIRRCSGGEKRRISIGIALITDPNILMLDEPTAGVDPHTRRFVWEILITLKNTGASMVLTSHSMEECEALCTRIAFLTHGRLKALGTSQHLKHVLGNQYLLNVSLTVPNEKLVEELHKQFTEKFQATGENPPTEIVLQWTFPKTNQTMSAMYKTLDEVVASANEQYPLPVEASGSQEPTSTQSSETAKKPTAIRDCMITGATLEDIFVKLAQVQEKTKGLI